MSFSASDWEKMDLTLELFLGDKNVAYEGEFQIQDNT